MKLSLKYYACGIGIFGVMSGGIGACWLWMAEPDANSALIGGTICILVSGIALDAMLGFFLIDHRLKSLESADHDNEPQGSL